MDFMPIFSDDAGILGRGKTVSIRHLVKRGKSKPRKLAIPSSPESDSDENQWKTKASVENIAAASITSPISSPLAPAPVFGSSTARSRRTIVHPSSSSSPIDTTPPPAYPSYVLDRDLPDCPYDSDSSSGCSSSTVTPSSLPQTPTSSHEGHIEIVLPDTFMVPSSPKFKLPNESYEALDELMALPPLLPRSAGPGFSKPSKPIAWGTKRSPDRKLHIPRSMSQPEIHFSLSKKTMTEAQTMPQIATLGEDRLTRGVGRGGWI